MTIMKLNKFFFIGGLMVLLFFSPPASVNGNNTMKNQSLILSTGNELIEGLLQDGQFKVIRQPFLAEKWQRAVWPNFNRKTGQVYFEATNTDFGSTPHVFAFSFPAERIVPEIIIEGRYPSVSPTGSLLAYYRHPNQLWVMDLRSKKSTKLILNYAGRNPATWLSDEEILYNDTANHLYKINTSSGAKVDTGFQKVIPGALSPDGEMVLCGSYDGKIIYLYSTKTDKLKILKKLFFLSMGSCFIWFPDSSHFFFTRQTFSNQIKLKESRSLFYSSMEMEEQKLVDIFSLFGGFLK